MTTEKHIEYFCKLYHFILPTAEWNLQWEILLYYKIRNMIIIWWWDKELDLCIRKKTSASTNITYENQ